MGKVGWLLIVLLLLNGVLFFYPSSGKEKILFKGFIDSFVSQGKETNLEQEARFRLVSRDYEDLKLLLLTDTVFIDFHFSNGESRTYEGARGGDQFYILDKEKGLSIYEWLEPPLDLITADRGVLLFKDYPLGKTISITIGDRSLFLVDDLDDGSRWVDLQGREEDVKILSNYLARLFRIRGDQFTPPPGGIIINSYIFEASDGQVLRFGIYSGVQEYILLKGKSYRSEDIHPLIELPSELLD